MLSELVLVLGVAYALKELYQAAHLPGFFYYLTLQFLPYWARAITFSVFGVGWAVNLYRAKTLMEEAYRRLMGSPEPVSIRMTVRTEGRAKKPDVVITRE